MNKLLSTLLVVVMSTSSALLAQDSSNCKEGSCGTSCEGAAPLPTEGFSKIIPVDKQLPPAWVKSLTDRGVPTVYRGEALTKIGMPVGGITCGTVYLGGDGKLWAWDIFNRNQNGVINNNASYKGRTVNPQNGANYVSPSTNQPSPFLQGFALRVTSGDSPAQIRTMDRTGWEEVSFTGTYPVGTVHYADPACPVSVKLEAFSPFIPLNADDSGLPCTMMRYTVSNTGHAKAVVELGGWLENAVLLDSSGSVPVTRINRISREAGTTFLDCSVSITPDIKTPARPPIVIETFEKDNYEGWTVEGTAFGNRPVAQSSIPPYQGNIGLAGKQAVNSHASAPGSDTLAKDAQTGRLLSKEFVIDRKHLSFLIGGGNHPGKTCLNLLVGGKVVRTATGHNSNAMHPVALDVSTLADQSAQIEILDAESGPWGNIGVDQIVLTDVSDQPALSPKAPDFGTMALAVLDDEANGAAGVDAATLPATLFTTKATPETTATARPLVGGLVRPLKLSAGESATVTFVIAWHFPNCHFGVKGDETGRYYAKRFPDAHAVAAYLAGNEKRLTALTLLWRDTWYDSTLPFWFLDRTFANTCTLATTTCHRFGTGRFYAWEGVGCCAGTCTHVWGYAQAMGRIFPELERYTREFVDLGVGFNPDGGVGMRAEHSRTPAVDGQCMRILGVLREHEMSAGDDFLKRVWPNTKKAIQHVMAMDKNGDGLLDAPQHNTLDAAWYGKIPWISGLYLATLKAGERMATDMADAGFAADCRNRAATGRNSINTLFNGEWFIQTPDPAHKANLGSYETCEIDQVLGQSWAWQVGLGRVIDQDKALAALHSLWKYNFALNLDDFEKAAKPKGRPYFCDGEGGLVMTANVLGRTNPFGDGNFWSAVYFFETMSGFEHQVASHMIAEGMVQEGLAVTRAIHDRYDGNKRNPYNEVECSDHYARAMSSYGSFISICGFEYDGPKGIMGFSPRLTPDQFKAPFTSAEGWGTFSQTRGGDAMTATLDMKHGALRLSTLNLTLPGTLKGTAVTVKAGGRTLPATLAQEGSKVTISLGEFLMLKEGETVTFTIALAP